MNGRNNRRGNFSKKIWDKRNIEEVNSNDENIKAVNNQRDNFVKETCKVNHFEGKRQDSERGTSKQPTTKLFSDCVNDEYQYINSLELTKRVYQRITPRPSKQTHNQKTSQHKLKFKPDNKDS